MRAINKTSLVLGSSDIAVSLYSAIDEETRFKSISNCCNAQITQKRFCSSCNKEVSYSDVKKALEVGDTLKAVDTEKLKLDNGDLRILGIVADETEENGIFKDGLVWFVGIEVEKSKDKTNRNLMKFSYLREAIKDSKVSFIGTITTRGKEHIVLLKPYFKGIVAIGLYEFSRIRDIQEVSGYNLDFVPDTNVVKQMSETIKSKEHIAIKNIENKRQKILEGLLEAKTEIENTGITPKKEELENPLELVCF